MFIQYKDWLAVSTLHYRCKSSLLLDPAPLWSCQPILSLLLFLVLNRGLVFVLLHGSVIVVLSGLVRLSCSLLLNVVLAVSNRKGCVRVCLFQKYLRAHIDLLFSSGVACGCDCSKILRTHVDLLFSSGGG